MKIVNILGGLGNQMFEYAMYLALKNIHPEEKIYCSINSFKGYGLHNGYELYRIFGIKVNEPSLLELANLAYPFINYKSWQIMQHFFPKRKSMTLGTTQIPFDYNEILRTDSVFYDGYWQNENNFKSIRDVVLEKFSFPDFDTVKNVRLKEVLEKENSVSLHVRRGDYLKEPAMCVCTPKYYERAITMMNDIVHPTMYCIFSDDVVWCKKELKQILGNVKVEFVDWNNGSNSYRDMQLMSLCSHNIIANSSFSWWGAWLNKNINKVVIAPEQWMNRPLKNDPICESWLRVQVD